MESFEVLENPVREKIIKEFLKKQEILEYQYIKDYVKKDTTRPDYHLNLLVESGLLERTKGRGNYRLNLQNLQLLRNIYKRMTPICLIGGLGKEVELYSEILDMLKNISIIPRKYVIITSPEANKEFEQLSSKDDFKKIYDVDTKLHLFDYIKELKGDYDKIQEFSEKLIREHIYNFEIITELTGGTKLITIALVKLAEKYNLRKIYYSSEEIKWL